MVAVNRIETVVDYFGGPGRKERRDRLAGEVACSRPPLGRFLTPGAGPWTRTTPRQYFYAAPLHMKSSSARKRAPAPVFGENLSCTDDVCCAPPCPSPRPPRRLPRQWRRPQSSPIIISLAAQMADAEASSKRSCGGGRPADWSIPAAACCGVLLGVASPSRGSCTPIHLCTLLWAR